LYFYFKNKTNDYLAPPSRPNRIQSREELKRYLQRVKKRKTFYYLLMNLNEYFRFMNTIRL